MDPSITHTTDGLARILNPIAECFTLEVAEKVVALRADAELQARIDELAAKCNEGAMTSQETREYDAYIRAMDMVAILQKKARSLISAAPES